MRVPPIAALASSLLALLASCTPPLLVPAASPMTKPTTGPGRGASAVRDHVRVDARAGAWSGEPRDLDRSCTPIFVSVFNDASIPIRVAPDELVMVTGGATFLPLPPASVWPGSPDVTRLALAPRAVSPHAVARGFVYFERVAGFFGPIDVRARLVDARTGAPYATISVPFLLKPLPAAG